jgi:type I restriction enzyme R subunit
MFDAPESDIFDVLAYLSFSEEMKTRGERASRVQEHSSLIEQQPQLQAREFLEYVLRFYTQYGSEELVQSKIAEVIKLYGKEKFSVMDVTNAFGSYEALLKAWKEVQGELFRI